MAALDFPDTPAVGDIYGSWRWDGTRWSSAAGNGVRGVVAYAQLTASHGGFTTRGDVNNLSVTWTADPSRRYRTTVGMEVIGTVANDLLIAHISNAATTLSIQRCLLQMGNPVLSGTTYAKAHFSHVETGLSGTQTRRAQLERNIGTGTAGCQALPALPAFIMVEDVTYEVGSGSSVATFPQFRRFTFSGLTLVQSTTTVLPFVDGAGDVLGNIGNRAAGFFALGEKGLYVVDAMLTYSTTFGATPGLAIDLAWTENQSAGSGVSLGSQPVMTPWGTSQNTWLLDHTQANVTANREYILRCYTYVASLTSVYGSIRVSRVSARP